MKPETLLGRAAGPALLTPDLRRGVWYRLGYHANDAEVLAVLDADLRILVTHYEQVGRWVARIDALLQPRDPSWATLAPRALSGIAVNNPSQDERARRSAAMKAVWAKKRARGERLPAPPSARLFGQRGPGWRTPEQRHAMSVKKRAWWAQRKAALVSE